MLSSELLRNHASQPSLKDSVSGKAGVNLAPLDLSSLQRPGIAQKALKQRSSEMHSCDTSSTTAIGSFSICNEARSSSPRHSSDNSSTSSLDEQKYWVKATFRCPSPRPDSRPRQGWRFDGWRDRRRARPQHRDSEASQEDLPRCEGDEDNTAIHLHRSADRPLWRQLRDGNKSPIASPTSIASPSLSSPSSPLWHRPGSNANMSLLWRRPDSNTSKPMESPNSSIRLGSRLRRADSEPHSSSMASPSSSSRSVPHFLRLDSIHDESKFAQSPIANNSSMTSPSSSSRSVPRLWRPDSEASKTPINLPTSSKQVVPRAWRPDSEANVSSSLVVDKNGVDNSRLQRSQPMISKTRLQKSQSSDCLSSKAGLSPKHGRIAASRQDVRIGSDSLERPAIFTNSKPTMDTDVDSEEDVVESYPGERLLRYLKLSDLSIWRSSPHPPAMVAAVLANVCCLLGLPEDWEAIRSALRSVSVFSKQLQNFDITLATKKQVRAIQKRRRKCPGAFDPQIVLPISLTCSVLSEWVNAVCSAADKVDEVHGDVAFLAALKKDAVHELRRLARPPELVAAVLGNVHCLLGLDESWDSVRANLRNTVGFLKQLHYFDQASASPLILQRIRRRHQNCPESFDFDNTRSVNATCGILCEWVNAICARADLGFTSPTRSMCITPRRPRRPWGPPEMDAAREEPVADAPHTDALQAMMACSNAGDQIDNRNEVDVHMSDVCKKEGRQEACILHAVHGQLEANIDNKRGTQIARLKETRLSESPLCSSRGFAVNELAICESQDDARCDNGTGMKCEASSVSTSEPRRVGSEVARPLVTRLALDKIRAADGINSDVEGPQPYCSGSSDFDILPRTRGEAHVSQALVTNEVVEDHNDNGFEPFWTLAGSRCDDIGSIRAPHIQFNDEESNPRSSRSGGLHDQEMFDLHSTLTDSASKSTIPNIQVRYRRKQQPKQQKNHERGDETPQLRGEQAAQASAEERETIC